MSLISMGFMAHLQPRSVPSRGTSFSSRADRTFSASQGSERAVRAGFDVRGEVPAQTGVSARHAIDRVPEAPLDVDPGPLHVRCRPAVAATETHGPGQLLRDGLDFLLCPLDATSIPETLGLLELVLEAVEPLAVVRFGAGIEYRTGIAGRVFGADQLEDVHVAPRHLQEVVQVPETFRMFQAQARMVAPGDRPHVAFTAKDEG